MALVETDAEGVEEMLVEHALADQHVGDRGNKSGVGPGPHRDPLVGDGHGCRCSWDRRLSAWPRWPCAPAEDVDDHRRRSCASLGIVAAQHDELGVDDIVEAVAGHPAAVEITDDGLDLRGAVVAVLGEETSAAIHEASN